MSLDSIPYDVFFHLASFLHLEDIVHVCLTHPKLTLFLNENTICRKIIQTHVPNSREAHLAKARTITYGEAVRMVYQRRLAFSNAHPFSAWVAGRGASFLYRQGMICVLNDTVLQIISTHSTRGRHEIALYTILAGGISLDLQFQLLYFNDSIVTGCCQEGHGRRSILAIDTRKGIHNTRRLMRVIQIGDHRRLFVRHSSSFLCWGTRSGEASSLYEWVIRITSMDPHSKETNEYSLPDFHGKDIGSTVAFEIHDGYFYAVSTRTTFEVEEIDWTSFYVCIRFPLQMKKPLSSLMERKLIWRRQHTEGPIIDSWTHLSIQRDERTDKLFIVEGRREWQTGSSGHSRNFYMTLIDPQDFATDGNEDYPLPTDDPLVSLLSPSDRPHYAPGETRAPWQVHSEPLHGPERTFNRPHTKFGAYNFASDTFLDLVEDSHCCTDPSTSCLRLRMGSRRPAPLDLNLGLVTNTSPARSAEDGAISRGPSSDDERPYRYTPIKYWPPPASRCPCLQRLHKLLSPYDSKTTSSESSVVTGALDEHGFVYMIRPRRSYDAEHEEAGTIVVLNFSPDISADAETGGPEEITNGESELSDWTWRRGRREACQGGAC